MLDTVKKSLENENITRVGMIDINECEIINPRILPSDARSAIIFCIPYRSTKTLSNDGFSEYARTYDYHKYSYQLFDNILQSISEITKHKVYGFCDHSPINEKLAAAKCGLGIIGRNSLFIDKVYGSFVFLGTIITDAPSKTVAYDIKHCHDCNKCINACPGNAIRNHGIERSLCLSAISQKKKKSEQEKQLLKEHNIVWGCDICQAVCPYNQSAEISPISFFKEARIVDHIDKNFILSLDNENFEKYAFSYKGKDAVLDNMD